MRKLDSFSKLIIVYVLWLGSWMLGATLFEVYFLSLGMSPQEIYLANAFWYAASVIAFPLFRRFSSRKSMIAGMALSASCLLLLYAFPDKSAAYAFRLVIGLTNLLFWLPFNVMFYEYSRGNNAQLGALYYSLGPILSLALPTVAGLIAGSLGFPELYLLSAFLFIITMAVTLFFVEEKRYSCDPVQAVRSISGLKSVLFLEGFSGMVIVSVTLPVMLLSFITTPVEYGLFLSLGTVFSVMAALLTAKLSDKVKERRRFILPVVAAFALSSVLASLSGDVFVFFLAFGLVSFFSRIFFPLPLALAVDNSKSLPEAMLGRELMLNAGRLAGALAGYAVFVYSDIRAALLFQGLLLFLYVPIFENRRKKLLRH